MFVVSFFSFRKKEPFVDVMVNEVPRKNFVVGVMARHKRIGIGEIGTFARAIFARDALQLMPDLARGFALGGIEAFEDRADPAISPGHQRLKISLARRFGIELHGAELRELARVVVSGHALTPSFPCRRHAGSACDSSRRCVFSL